MARKIWSHLGGYCFQKRLTKLSSGDFCKILSYCVKDCISTESHRRDGCFVFDAVAPFHEPRTLWEENLINYVSQNAVPIEMADHDQLGWLNQMVRLQSFYCVLLSSLRKNVWKRIPKRAKTCGVDDPILRA
jgi:hypothetical protein